MKTTKRSLWKIQDCGLPSLESPKIGVLKKLWVVSVRKADEEDSRTNERSNLTPRNVPGRKMRAKKVIKCMDPVSFSVLSAILFMLLVISSIR
jgi:hypothetical protein